MKYILILVAVFFTACVNDKKILNLMNSNTNRYVTLSKTYYKDLKSSIVTIKDISTSTKIREFQVDIKPKDIDEKIYINLCKIDNTIANSTQLSTKYSSWSSSYKISFNNINQKSTIVCQLSNKEVFEIEL